MKTLMMIVTAAAVVTTASAQEFRAPLGRQKPVRPIEKPVPLEGSKVEGALPKAFGPGRNPLQMLNPWAPPRYGIWVENTAFDPNYPGKWNGIKLFEIIF